MLLFLLDSVKQSANIFLLKFKNAGVVQMRSVLFGGKRVGAKVAVVLFVLGLGNGVVSGKARLR